MKKEQNVRILINQGTRKIEKNYLKIEMISQITVG